MIEINLLPGPKKKKSAGGAGITLDQIKELFQQVKDPLLAGAVVSWIVGLGLIGFFYTTDTKKMAGLQQELTQVEAEQKRFAALIAQKHTAEQLRDSLIAELNVIRAIDGERFVWPHILEEVGRALPDYTWLQSIQPVGKSGPSVAGAPDQSGSTGLRISIEGRTSDIQAYTRFLRQLSTSPWITNIVAGPTNVATEQNRPVTSFSLTADFKHADSAYIRTAPLIQTLR